MTELIAAINGFLPDATAAGVAMAMIGITLAVISLVRRKA